MLDQLQHLLVSYGELGMFVSAFLAGSVLPFNSEIVLIALYKGGASAQGLLLWGTIGNVLGGLLNFYIGSLGKEEWIAKWTHVSPEKLEKGKYYVHKYGAIAGLLAWIPILGSVITVALGYLRTNVYVVSLTMAIGKFLRYAVLLWIFL